MTRKFKAVSLLTLGLLGAWPLAAQSPPLDMSRPIAAHDTLFMEELTWLEVRDALNAGKKTIIIPTGGVEQNGPYLVTGKHNYVLRATTQAIAKKLGNALIAPIIPFVPEGDIDPPTGHMKYPGTISLTEDTYQRLLIDICASVRTHGFEHLVLIGDSGGNQKGLKAVAEKLNKQWAGGKTRVYYIAEYYDGPDIDDWLEKQGITEKDDGHHDSFAITATMMTVDPTTVRMKQRLAADQFRINGINLAPADKTIAWGKKIVEFRAESTVQAIRKAMAPAKK